MNVQSTTHVFFKQVKTLLFLIIVVGWMLACIALLVTVQISRYQHKQWLSSATDLQRIQYMLLGGKPEYLIREAPRMRMFNKTFKRRAAMAQRR